MCLFIIKDYSLLFKYDIFNYFLIQLNNLHFYILKNLFIPDIVQVLFKLYHAFFYFVHINIMDQLYYSNLLEQYFYFPNKRAKKTLFFSFSNSFFNFSISFNCSFLDLVVLLIDLFLLSGLFSVPIKMFFLYFLALIKSFILFYFLNLHSIEIFYLPVVQL